MKSVDVLLAEQERAAWRAVGAARATTDAAWRALGTAPRCGVGRHAYAIVDFVYVSHKAKFFNLHTMRGYCSTDAVNEFIRKGSKGISPPPGWLMRGVRPADVIRRGTDGAHLPVRSREDLGHLIAWRETQPGGAAVVRAAREYERAVAAGWAAHAAWRAAVDAMNAASDPAPKGETQ